MTDSPASSKDRPSPEHLPRAGRYVRQPTGYSAFLPAPLPPEPPVLLVGELQTLLSQADRALGRLDGSVLTLPNPDLFVFMYVRKEAVLSSQIEGTQSSLQDLLAAEAATQAFGHLLTGTTATASQIEFIGQVVNHLTEHGTMPASRLYESPFTDIHAQGPDGVFAPTVMEQFFTALDTLELRTA